MGVATMFLKGTIFSARHVVKKMINYQIDIAPKLILFVFKGVEMASTKQILRKIKDGALKKKKKEAEVFNFKKNTLLIKSFRFRDDQIGFLNALKDSGYNTSKVVRQALDKEFKKPEYRTMLEKFKDEF